jgi:tetratricopeptide (TPR) repeat protein
METKPAMNQGPRLEKLKEMVARFPDDPRARYFLAHELFRVEDWAGAAEQYDAYWKLAPGDEGAALKNLGLCFERLGRNEAAAEAYNRGIERALAHGHEGLASEIRFLLAALDA